MTHDEALQKGLVEKFLLCELQEPELSEFEAHFADCPICNPDLGEGEDFMSYLKSVLQDRRDGIGQESGTLPELDETTRDANEPDISL